MRERLTLAFIAIAAVMMVFTTFVPRWAIDDEELERDRVKAGEFADLVALQVADRVEEGTPVDAGVIEPFATDDRRLVYVDARGAQVTAGGDALGPDTEVVDVDVAVGGGGGLTVTERTDADAVGPWGRDWGAIAAILIGLVLVAGSAGYAVARSLSNPFRQLAVGAAALGRGRFDLDLPRGGVPEARAIAGALELSAGQLRDRLERERAFGLHASHVLRTPLTSLGFRLEELVEDPGLPADARETARACLEAVAQLDAVAGELVELGARGVLVAGAAVPLRELATQIAQRWADALDDDDRRVTAAVEGDIEQVFTPGPVEQVLDLLLEEIVVHETGSVRMVFDGSVSRLRIDLTCSRSDGSSCAPTPPIAGRVTTVLDALGGRLEQSTEPDLLRVYLPRR